MIFATVGFTLAAPLAQFAGMRKYKNFKKWQPFEGQSFFSLLLPGSCLYLLFCFFVLSFLAPLIPDWFRQVALLLFAGK
jgi:hypothetical protein